MLRGLSYNPRTERKYLQIAFDKGLVLRKYKVFSKLLNKINSDFNKRAKYLLSN